MKRPLLGLALCFTLMHAARAQPYQLESLGQPPGLTDLLLTGLSADGQVLVGNGFDSNGFNQAFRWTEAEGFERLLLPGSQRKSVAGGISGDGQVIAGTTIFQFADSREVTLWENGTTPRLVGLRGFTVFDVSPVISRDGSSLLVRQTEGDDFARHWRNGALSLINGLGSVGTNARSISASGDVVVGVATTQSSNFLYRWTLQGGMQDLGSLGGSDFMDAFHVSLDGSCVVGNATRGSETEVFRWTQASGLQGLGVLPGASSSSSFDRVSSSDCLVVVGNSGATAFRWTPAGGMVSLGSLPNQTGVRGATVVSADGSTIIGGAGGVGLREGFVWTEASGLQGLGQLPGGNNSEPLYVSDDGAIVVGFARNASGQKVVVRWTTTAPPSLVVNDPGDTPDADPEDGACATDDGTCTLRAALMEANAVASGEPAPRITFALPPEAQIRPQTDLPTVARAMTIDGGTGRPVLNGGLLLGASGLRITASGVSVRGLVVVNAPRFGIDVDGAAGVSITGSFLGVLPDGTPLENDGGAVRIGGASGDATVGSRGPVPDRNTLFGPLVVTDGARARVLLNTMEIAEADASGLDLRSPLDVDDDGPTCGAWVRASGATPAPPRVLALSSSSVRGLSAPGDTVLVYQIREKGSGNGRYWARRVTPLALTVADATGAFEAAVNLSANDFVALTALSPEARTSELSQAIRPVIFAPGIGGTWLRSADATDLWLPFALGSDAKNERMRRIGMQPDGATSNEPITANEVLELGAVYGPIHEHLQQQGYPGDPFNANPPTLDQWRFPNDWRRSAAVLADDFHALVDRVTTASGETAQSAARSCQTDVIAHSNGGVIASVYLRRDAAHARDRITRFITSGTPYLGADQAYAAHTNGYVFGADEALSILGGWDVAWGDMIGMVRNVPGAYALLPSRAYFDAVNEASPSHAHGYGLVDLYNVPLDGYDATINFLTDAKVDLGVVPSGMARNALIRIDQDAVVQSLIADWRTYEGPPQIFRHVGQTVGQTEVGWFMGPGPEFVASGDTPRSETGDTDRHRAYRERLRPVMGLGDHTVPLVSATLGRSPLVGRLDLSGVDESPWIEEFEAFECAHGNLVARDCLPLTDGGLEALPRLTELLASTSIVPFESASGAHPKAAIQASETIYAMATAPITVTATDASGRLTGPPEASAPGDVAFEIPGVVYRASRFGAMIALPPDSAYTLTVRSADPGAVVTLVRQRHTLGGVTQILYPDQPLATGGTLMLALASGGTPEAAAWALDADGDGTPEVSIAPAAVLSATSSALALPLPQPSAVEIPAATASDVRTVTLRLPDTGTEGWSFALSETAPWLTLSTASGAVPAEVTLTLDPAGLPDGPAETAISLTLTNGGYTTRTTVPVTLRVGLAVAGEAPPEAPRVLALRPPAPNPASGAVAVGVDLPEAATVRVTVHDALGRTVAILADGPLAAGAHALSFDARGLAPGVYVVRLATPEAVLTRRVTVAR